MLIPITCAQCGAESLKSASAANRSARDGAPVYCNRVCAGLARRRKVPVTKAQLVERKRLYDAEYRRKNVAAITAKKAAHYQATRDPEAERAYRKANMARHVEYCRRPEYRTKKSEYDKQLRASEYGDFAEAYLLLREVEKELNARMSKYERMKAKGYFTRNAQQRRRQLWQLMQSVRI